MHISEISSKLTRRPSFPPWWAPIRSGLVRDPTGKHHTALRRAIWLYLYLIIVVDRRKGTVFRKLETIATETGFKVRSIQRWLTILRKGGYINTRNRGHSLAIEITKWRPTGRSRDGPYK
jgi:hypothetical protein